MLYTMFVVYEDESWDEIDFSAEGKLFVTQVKLAKRHGAKYIRLSLDGKVRYKWGNNALEL